VDDLMPLAIIAATCAAAVLSLWMMPSDRP
jgi:hypothetical protein